MRESARQFPVMAHLASSARPRLGRDALRTRPTSPTPQRLARVAREGGFSAIHRDGPRRGDARDASRRAPFARRVRALRASFSRGALRRRARVSRGGRRRRRRARRRRRVLPVLPRRVTDRPRPRGAPSPVRRSGPRARPRRGRRAPRPRPPPPPPPDPPRHPPPAASSATSRSSPRACARAVTTSRPSPSRSPFPRAPRAPGGDPRAPRRRHVSRRAHI